MPIKARIWWDDSTQAYVISSSYNERLVDALKGVIPSGDRSYEPASKFWFVKENYGAFIRQLAESAFGVGSVSFTSKDVAQQSSAYQSQTRGAQGAYLQTTLGTVEDAIVAFFALLPYSAAKRAYLQAAQDLHPDKPQGDAVKMTKLNELWDRITKEYYKR